MSDDKPVLLFANFIPPNVLIEAVAIPKDPGEIQPCSVLLVIPQT